MTEYKITLSTTEPNNNVGIVKLRHADVSSQAIVAQIVENGQPKNFEGLQPYFCLMAQEITGQGVSEESIVSFDAKKGTLTYTASDNALQFVGRNEAYFSFRKQVGDQWVEQFSTRTFHYIVEKSIYSQPFKDSNYWWTFKELYRIFNQYIDDGKKSWEEFVNQNKEIIESVDPGGVVLSELIEARSSSKGTKYSTLSKRIAESETLVYNVVENPDYVNVVQHGIKNDGTLIPEEQMDEIVRDNIGKTLFFPAGTYNLGGPIKTFCNPDKQVNFNFDVNAVIKTDLEIECLMFIGGFDEVVDNDNTQLEIYGGQFKAANCQYGILINRRKMNVTLQSNRIYEAQFANVMFKVVNDIDSPHSSTDVNIRDLFVHGKGLEDGESYGIYLPKRSHDTKISNLRVQYCSTSIFTDSGGNYITNAHFMPTGTLTQIVDSIGIHFGPNSQGGTLLNCYFDTVGTGVRIDRADDVQLNCVDAELYSYLSNLRMVFFDIPQFTKMSKFSLISPKIFFNAPNSYVVKTDMTANGYDYYERFKIIGMQLVNQTMRASDDLSRKMGAVDRYFDLAYTDGSGTFETGDQYALGLMLRCLPVQIYRICIKNSLVVDIGVRVVGNVTNYGVVKVFANVVAQPYTLDYSVQINAVKAKLGYVLAIRFLDKQQTNPVITVTDITQCGNYLAVDSKTSSKTVDFFEGIDTTASYELFRI